MAKRHVEYGKSLLQLFEFDPEYRHLNHGSFGAAPRDIRKHMRHHQDLAESRPDSYIRYEYPVILDECRAAMAKLVNAHVDTIVFVPNATVGVNTVFQNLTWDDDGKDEIIYFSTIYGACAKIVDYVVDSTSGKVSSRAVPLSYPCEDEDVVKAFHSALEDSGNAGKRAKICLFDTVSSLPGVCFPYEAIIKACRDAGVLSLVDGAQAVGLVPIDLDSLDPDFFVSNCHKWLYVPRSCAVFHVPLRNQHMITTTTPTSHGYVPQSGSRFNPLPPSKKSAFVNNFEFVGTLDTSAYVCVKEAIEWRERVLGGEKEIFEYCHALAVSGGHEIASILGTEVMDNPSHTMSKCAMINVALPLDGEDRSLEIQHWIMRTLAEEYKTFIPLKEDAGRVWARLSAQVYTDMDDFIWAGQTLLAVCNRVKRGDASQTHTEDS
ncbi:pyridoxal phosphate-dependent transferase [Xylaria bambusicola]|uniref:pyridoxal phosphate-dependent transferase n=1 Tax=Xylaria bambusicola TaxID=326684 RepID=UPI00200728F4|nr:pyridoxal phosphate-dependent transferase [Xylaria bambusicola]KAI0508884.1 pyridoxal phosphate-dependent transferase [Xylaria bambusicola]